MHIDPIIDKKRTGGFGDRELLVKPQTTAKVVGKKGYFMQRGFGGAIEICVEKSREEELLGEGGNSPDLQDLNRCPNGIFFLNGMIRANY